MHRYKPLQPGWLPALETGGVSGISLSGEVSAGSAVFSVASVNDKRNKAYLARQSYDVLLLGFGDGTVLIDCLEDWRGRQAKSAAAASVSPRLHVVIVDEYPLHWTDVIQCLGSCSAWALWSEAFQGQHRPLLPGLHRMRLFAGQVRIDWVCGEAHAWLGACLGRYDLGMLSWGPLPVSLNRLPVWRAKTFYDLQRCLRADGMLVSEVKDPSIAIQYRQWAQYANWRYVPDSATGHACIDQWFSIADGEQSAIKAVSGFEWLTAHRRESHDGIRGLQDLQVAVVGAGLAGIHVAAALVRFGVQVTIFDSGNTICQGASGNPVGAFHPHVSIDDAVMSRLSRLGINTTVSSLEQLTALGYLERGIDWDLPGHIQLFDDAEDEKRFLKALQTLQWPTDELDILSPEEIAHRLGFEPAQSGLWLKQAGWVKPERWCEALLARSADDQRSGLVSGSISLKTGCEVVAITERSEDGQMGATEGVRRAVEISWRTDGNATLSASFDRVVIAAAQGSLPLWKQAETEQKTVKGQVSFVDAPGPLPAVVSGASYAIDMQVGQWLIGATFERPAADTSVTDSAHASNVVALQRAFPGIKQAAIRGGRSAIRCAWPDRLPALGPALRKDGSISNTVWYATGYGSRGITWAAMGAEWLSDCWAGYSPALTQDLAAAVFPGRFFSRASNSKPTLPSLPNTR